jgi:large subunit ribosomal protein L32
MVPKQRHTHGRTGRRRAHHALKAVNVLVCKKCNSPKLAHVQCETCGYYKERMVTDVAARFDKKERKALEKQQKEAAAAQAANQPLSMEGLSQK